MKIVNLSTMQEEQGTFEVANNNIIFKNNTANTTEILENFYYSTNQLNFIYKTNNITLSKAGNLQ